MCVPIAVAALALSAVGTGIGIMGQMQQAKAQASAANYQSEVAANNAKIATQNATWANQAGEQQQAQAQLKTRAQVGGILAAQAASGVDVNKGSTIDVRSSAAETGQLDALTLRSNAARQAYGYDVQSTSDTAQSQLDSATASNIESAAPINAASTFLGGAGNAASKYAEFTQKSTRMTAGDGLSQTED